MKKYLVKTLTSGPRSKLVTNTQAHLDAWTKGNCIDAYEKGLYQKTAIVFAENLSDCWDICNTVQYEYKNGKLIYNSMNDHVIFLDVFCMITVGSIFVDTETGKQWIVAPCGFFVVYINHYENNGTQDTLYDITMDKTKKFKQDYKER